MGDELGHLRSCLDEQIGLPLSVFDAATGSCEVSLVQFDTDKVSAHLNGCDAGSAATHERIEDCLVCHAGNADEALNDRKRLYSWVRVILNNRMLDDFLLLASIADEGCAGSLRVDEILDVAAPDAVRKRGGVRLVPDAQSCSPAPRLMV
jgi:hypothetical protein